ncbi:MAG: hypothetical protein WB565_03810 [Acidimicrobiales bacterium]
MQNISAPSRGQPLRISDSLKELILGLFTASQLRHLAALKESAAPGMRARHNLDDKSAEELAQMLLDGRTPTVGWWRRLDSDKAAA